jgi:hypothetical protein
MKQSILKLRNGFESSSGLTEQFRDFFKVFKREFSKELRSIGATNLKFSRGHFYVSGFFTVNDKPYYFSLSDVRGWTDKLLYRTVKDYNDYTGGSNQYVKIENGMCHKMKL